jgi:hypothetical protein
LCLARFVAAFRGSHSNSIPAIHIMYVQIACCQPVASGFLDHSLRLAQSSSRTHQPDVRRSGRAFTVVVHTRPQARCAWGRGVWTPAEANVECKVRVRRGGDGWRNPRYRAEQWRLGRGRQGR